MAPLVRSRFYIGLEQNQESFSKLLREITGEHASDYDEPITLTRGQLISLECCFNNLLNTFMWNEEERIQKAIEQI